MVDLYIEKHPDAFGIDKTEYELVSEGLERQLGLNGRLPGKFDMNSPAETAYVLMLRQYRRFGDAGSYSKFGTDFTQFRAYLPNRFALVALAAVEPGMQAKQAEYDRFTQAKPNPNSAQRYLRETQNPVKWRPIAEALKKQLTMIIA